MKWCRIQATSFRVQWQTLSFACDKRLLHGSCWTSPGLCRVHVLQCPTFVQLGFANYRSLRVIRSGLVSNITDLQLVLAFAVRCRIVPLAQTKGHGVCATMPQASAASGPREEPAGMEAEAQLLTSLQEIPNISKCWLRPAQADGFSLTVGSPCCCPLPACSRSGCNSEPAAVPAYMFNHSPSQVCCPLQ